MAAPKRTPAAVAAPEPTLPGLAREALAAHDGDTFAATNALCARLQGDVKLLRAVLAFVVRDAVDNQIQGGMRHRRGAILKAIAQPGRNAVIALANGISAALLDLPLAGGLRLRDATRADVLKQAQFYDASAVDMHRKARWLQQIAALVEGERKVGEALSEERAVQLWQEAGR